MRTTRLAFNDLQNGFDVIARENLRSIKGGVAEADPEWGTWDGVLYTRTPGGEWEYYATLPEVIITPPSGYNPSTALVLGSNPFGAGFGSGDGYTNAGNENNPGGSNTPNVNPSNGIIKIGPSWSDTILIENLGAIYGAAGSIWSVNGTYGVTQALDNSTTLNIDLSVTDPLSFTDPSISGNVKIYDSNNNVVFSFSLSDPRIPGVNYYTANGTSPLGSSITLPSTLSGNYTVQIDIGAYNSTGAGYQGNSKSYSFNISVPSSSWEE